MKMPIKVIILGKNNNDMQVFNENKKLNSYFNLNLILFYLFFNILIKLFIRQNKE